MAISGATLGTGAAAIGDVNTRVYGQSLNAADVSRAARSSGSSTLTALADVFEQKRVAGTADNFDLGALQLEVDYYNALNDMQKLAYDLEPAVVQGTASLAEQMAYKIATGEKLTIAELNRLDRNDRAVVELGRLLDVRLDKLNYSQLTATLNSKASKNARQSSALGRLYDRYIERIQELEKARSDYHENQTIYNKHDAIMQLSSNQDSTILEEYEPYSFVIGRSVGAKAKNYDVLDNFTGRVYHFVEGTRIVDPKVFAGYKGVKPLYPETIDGLVREFGGDPTKWQHVKGKGILDVYGEEVVAEIHWFQEESVGKVKFKIKEWLYDED